MCDNLGYLLGLGDSFTNEDRKKYHRNKAQYNRKYSHFMRKVREEAKLPYCFHCKSEVESHCNSHSVPSFCLKNIAIEGKLHFTNTLIELPFFDEEKGVNKAGTFHLICRDCDSKIFSEYENPESYSLPPTQKMLSQIAMKTSLKKISKRHIETVIYNSLIEKTGSDYAESQLAVAELDLSDFTVEYDYAKKAIAQNSTNAYYMFFYHELDYVVPIAYQDSVVLVSDFRDNTVNQIYNYSSKYKTQELHICVFPMANKSVIIMFIKDGYRRYRDFYKDFKKMKLDDKLRSITYIMFAYSEDIYFSKNLTDVITSNEKLGQVTSQTSTIQSHFPFVDANSIANQGFSLSNRIKIPNLLSAEYKVVCK